MFNQSLSYITKRTSGAYSAIADFYRAMLCIGAYSAYYAVARCLSVRSVSPSVCHTPVFCRNG